MVEVDESLQVMVFLIDFLVTEIAEDQKWQVNGCRRVKKAGPRPDFCRHTQFVSSMETVIFLS